MSDTIPVDMGNGTGTPGGTPAAPSNTGKGYGSARELGIAAAADPAIAAAIAANPAEALLNVAEPLRTDTWIYRAVIIFLGLGMLTGQVGPMILASMGKTAPEGSATIAATAVGGLVILLKFADSRH